MPEAERPSLIPEPVATHAAPALDPFELSPDPIVLFSADGARLRANAAFAKTFPHALSGARPPWGRAAPPPFVEGERCFEAAAPDGRRYEWRERQLPGGARIAVARDVSARAEAADQAARAKTVLFATLTHELRTPLNGVLGMAGVLSQTVRTPAEAEYLRAIQRSGEHLLTLITEILDYARLESETVEIEEGVFDPEDMAQSIAELLSPSAYAKGVELIVRARPGVPRKVSGDERRVRQILLNLVGNAVKFTDEGAVAIELALAAPDRLRFTVRDTGPGVPQEMQMRIFEEFVQAESGSTRKYGGAGLGLAIVRKLVRRLGGEVGLDNSQGRGAAFWAELPARAVESAQTDRPLAGVRALIVSRGVLGDSLADLISEAGGAPRWPALDGLLAPVDVILLDHAVARGHVSAYTAYDAPVIALAPQEERAALAAYEAAGVQHYLVKPLRRASLIARVLTAIGKPSAGARPLITPPAPHARPARGLRVLMAEDNAVNALLARTLLERSGCVVTVVGDGAAAVEALAREAFDLAFLDLRMPVLDGMGAARQIRALSGPAARLPLIALTADAGEAERAAALAAGMDDFVTKPIHPGQLEEVLDRFTPPANEAKLAAS